jgi:outer membrane protein
MRKVIFTLLGFLTSAYVSTAQDAVKLSLDETIAYALAHNYTVKNARLDVQIADKQIKQQLSAAYPHMNGKLDVTNFAVPQRQFVDAASFNFDPKVVIPKETFIVPISFNIPWATAASLTTSQLLFDGSVFVALQARNTVMDMARRGEEVTEENVRYNVHKSYYALVVAYKQFDIVKGSLLLLRSMARDLEITRQNGFAEKIAVDRMNVQVNNLATDSLRIGNLLTVSEQMLKYNIGMDINTPIVLTDTNLQKVGEGATLLLAEEQHYERVPEYNLLTTSLEVSQYNLKRYRYAFIPTLSAFWQQGSNYGSFKFKDQLDPSKYWASTMLGVSLSVPIFNGMLRYNQVKEASLNVFKAKNNIENLKLGLDFQTASSQTTLKNSLLEVQSQRRNLELANTVLELAQKKYKAGVGDNLEVTNAQSELLRTQNNLFAALLNAINAEADLRKAMGLLKH